MIPPIGLSLLATLGACGGGVGLVTTSDLTPQVTPTPTVVANSPAPNEADTAWSFFGNTNAINKRDANLFDSVRYLDGFASGGKVYQTEVFDALGATGTSNILYRGDGAYFYDSVEEVEGNLSAGIGWLSDGTPLGGYMARNGASFTAPTGSVTYSGSYQGHVAEFAALSIYGNVTLNADFANATMTGAVTDRSIAVVPFGVDNPQLISADVALDASAISALGGFGSTISQTNGTASGFYGGIFDTDGDRAIGLVQVTHSNTVKGGGVKITETGIFKVD